MPDRSFTQLMRGVREHLDQDHRYAHSLRVARAAARLAARHGVDAQKARVAGLLHDLARLYTPERLIAEAEARGFEISGVERDHPMLLHARVGAALARERFGIQDAGVLSAIEKHTTAADSMSPLDSVVYLADSLEPARRFPERGELWNLAMSDLDAATALTVEHARRKYERKLARAEAAASTS